MQQIMDPLLAQRAINAALAGDWKTALALNKQILQEEPLSIDALNRLARAQDELGSLKQAEATYKRVIGLDPYNSIAQKALVRLEKAPKRANNRGYFRPLQTSFVEEPGRTKTVSLIHLGDQQVLASLDCGQQVRLVPHAHRVSAETEDADYIGRLPDDIASRIIKFTKSGNEYQAFVKSSQKNLVKVFIKEVKRAPTLADIPSFPQSEKTSYVSYTSPDLIHEERPEMAPLEEQDEQEQSEEY